MVRLTWCRGFIAIAGMLVALGLGIGIRLHVLDLFPWTLVILYAIASATIALKVERAYIEPAKGAIVLSAVGALFALGLKPAARPPASPGDEWLFALIGAMLGAVVGFLLFALQGDGKNN